jgi:V/A-type H+-transporting ATPase subunit E
MKTLDTDQDKIKKICEALRKDTLEPAEKDALRIVEEAKAEAKRIILNAEAEGDKIVKRAQAEIEQERSVFQSSLSQAAKQGIEQIRQEIQNKLFSPELEKLIIKETANPKTIASIVDAIIKAIEKQGLGGNLLMAIPKGISPQAVTSLLHESVIQRLKNESVELGSFKGGAKVRLIDKKMTLEMTDETLKELIASFISKDFRKFIFGH